MTNQQVISQKFQTKEIIRDVCKDWATKDFTAMLLIIVRKFLNTLTIDDQLSYEALVK